MKKTAVLIALIMLLLGAFALCASAETVDSGTCGNNLTWMLDDEGTLTISGTGNMISAPWRGDYNTQIKTVIMENGVTSIGGSAFRECTGLTSVTIPNSVKGIGEKAFYGCTGLTSVTIPDSVTSIGEYAFFNCTGLTSVTIGNSVTGIGGYAFYNCTGLTSVTIGNSVTSIGLVAFYNCTGLTSVTIPNSVTYIGDSAFRECTGLTSITIPDSVTRIGASVFSGCASLGSITIPFVGNIRKGATDTYQYPFGYLFGESSYSGGIPVLQYYYGSSISSSTSTTYYIPSSLKNVTVTGGGILYGAFYGCTGLASVTIGNSVTSIGNSAFSGCTGLTSVTIGNSVTSIGDVAFYNCTGLTSVTIPNSVKGIGERAFYGCTGLTSVTIGNGVTSIGWGAFSDCTGLGSITVSAGNPNYVSVNNCLIEKSSKTLILGCKNSVIPADGSVTSIGDSAFSGCTGLTSVTIPDSVTSIGDVTFSGCTGLTSITIPDSVTSIGEYAFSYCTGLTSITIPKSVTYIGEYAFSYCTGLTSVTIPNSVKSIGESAFRECTGLTSITIPNSVTSIGRGAFCNCTGLTSVTIGNSVTSIGWDAFYNCTGLTSVTIPDSVTSIDWSAFSHCTGLTRITIPGSVTSIGDQAFSDCTGLTSVTIPDSVTSIGDFAFSDCTGLTSVTIGNSVTSIGDVAFSGCTGLTSVTIPDSVTSIGLYAFRGCTGLTSVTIPNSVTYIGWDAFYDCNNLKYVYYGGTKADWDAIEIDADGNEPLFGALIHYSSTGDHTWENGTVTTPANCKQTGVKTYACTCPGCDAVKTESIPKTTNHSYKNVITKATLTADGKITPTCSVCGATKAATKINKVSKVALAETKFVYNGTVIKPAIIVTDSAGKTISSKYYTEKWSNENPYAVGKYTVTLTFKGNYSGSKTLTYTVVPKKVTGVKNTSAETKSIKLNWTKAAGAKYYEVYGSADGKTFKKITTVSTNSLKVTKVNGKALSAGKTYYFKVRALDAAKKCVGAFSSVLKTGTLTAAPKITKLTSTKSKTATVTWGKVTGAKKYVVYKSTDGNKWTKVASTAKTTYTLTKLTGGKPIYVKVLAVNAYSAKSAYSAVKSVTVKK